MKIGFCELPSALRVGGLEGACRGLEGALVQGGHLVESVERFDERDRLRGCSLVHFHGLWSLEHARLAWELRRLKIPYVTSPHGMLEPWAWKTKRWKKWPYFHAIERPKILKGLGVLATAEQEANRLERFFPEDRIHTLPLGSEFNKAPDYHTARAEMGWGSAERVILYLSRIHPKKGLKELIQALENLPLEILRAGKFRLVVVGDGPERYVEDCRTGAERLRDRLSLEWHDAVWNDRKWRFLQGADLFALPTYSENFGIVVLEACEVGTPVLTTVETPWKPVADAGFGWVVEPNIEAYQRALIDFAKHPPVSDAQRQACADWTRSRYSWSNLVTEYIRLYKAIASEGRMAER